MKTFTRIAAVITTALVSFFVATPALASEGGEKFDPAAGLRGPLGGGVDELRVRMETFRRGDPDGHAGVGADLGEVVGLQVLGCAGNLGVAIAEKQPIAG